VDGKLTRICRLHGEHQEEMNRGLINKVAELEAENKLLKDRLRIMWEWLRSRPIHSDMSGLCCAEFLKSHPEAGDWVDEEGDVK
jgi:hypothetical protein